MRYNHDHVLGMRFGRLLAVSICPHRNRHGHVLVDCVCDCGLARIFTKQSLLSGRVKSCGCFRKEVSANRFRTHGHTSHGSASLTYSTWVGMNERCHYEKNISFRYYGALGIQVCNEWRGPGGFQRFLSDVGLRPSRSHSLDRIDSNGNYEPGNVRWATNKEQGRNKKSNRIIEFNGEKMILSDWASRLGIGQGTLSHRLNSGWSIERAITTPLHSVK